ncbi:threonine and homoserine efflux system [compost metagenome]
MSIGPAVGALSGLLFLLEFLSLSQWMAILCIILASVGATMTMGSAAKPAIAAD